MADLNIPELLSGEGWQDRLAELNKPDLESVAEFVEIENPGSVRKGLLLLNVYEKVKVMKAEGKPETRQVEEAVSVEILDRQIQLKRMEIDLQRLKAEERERERQHELAMQALSNRGSSSSQHNVSAMPCINLTEALKLVPNFQEVNVAEFFVSFERIASRLEWPKEYWTTLIQSKLLGKAQKVYVTLDEDLSSDYDSVKAIVLKAYELVPEAYRQRFRNLQKERGQTFVEFARAKEQFAGDWLKSKEVTDFEKLKELILVEEFKRSVPNEVKVHLEELKLETLQEVAIASDEYLLSHKNVIGEVPRNEKSGWVRVNRSSNQNRYNRPNVNYGSRATPVNSYNRQTTDNPEKLKTLTCFFCHKKGHVKSMCYAFKRSQRTERRPVMAIRRNENESVAENSNNQ